MNSDEPTLSRRITSSGIAMSSRQAAGALLGVGGTLVVTRIVGPSTYGVFASAIAIQSYVGSFANSGVEVSLLRSRVDDHENQDGQGLLLVLVLSLLGALACLATLPLLCRWTKAPNLNGAGWLLFSSLPLTVIWIVPRARLSRRMAFGRIALIELISQGAGVTVSLVLAWLGAGIWAPTLGWFCQSLLLTLLFFQCAGPRPALIWNASEARHLIADAWSFSVSSLVWQAKSLVNPLIVGHYLGPESVGYVALCSRIIEALSFVRNATWHMMIVTFAKVASDAERLNSFLSRAAELQFLALAPFLVAFALLGPVVFPVVMGKTWQPVLLIFPYLAGGALAATLSTPCVAALYALGADARVLVIRLLQIGGIASTSWILVPRLGLNGYGYGELTVVLTAAIFGIAVRPFAGRTRFRVVASWAVAAVGVIFWRQLGKLAFVSPFLTLLVPGSWTAMKEQFTLLRNQFPRRR